MFLVAINISDECNDNDIIEWLNRDANCNTFQMRKNENNLQELLKEMANKLRMKRKIVDHLMRKPLKRLK